MNHKNNLSDAREMGKAHFKAGGKPASATDIHFAAFIKEYSTPDWRYTNKLIMLMKEWSKGWHSANLESEA